MFLLSFHWFPIAICALCLRVSCLPIDTFTFAFCYRIQVGHHVCFWVAFFPIFHLVIRFSNFDLSYSDLTMYFLLELKILSFNYLGRFDTSYPGTRLRQLSLGLRFGTQVACRSSSSFSCKLIWTYERSIWLHLVNSPVLYHFRSILHSIWHYTPNSYHEQFWRSTRKYLK